MTRPLDLTRRHLLAHVPVASAALALPTMANPAEYRSPFPALYARMIELRDLSNTIDLDEPAFQDACDRLFAVQDEILRTVPVTASDVGFQIVAADDAGDQFHGSAWAATLAAHAYLSLGLPLPEIALTFLAEFRDALGSCARPELLAQVDGFLAARAAGQS